MDKKQIVEKFHTDSVGLRFYENPVTLHVWEYSPWPHAPNPDPPVYEYVLHYGDHGESSTEQYATQGEACEAAWAKAIEYLEGTLKEFKGE